MLPALPFALAMAYGIYSGARFSGELRYLNDYKQRYPWVDIRYPTRTSAFKTAGNFTAFVGSNSRRYSRRSRTMR